MGSRHLLGFACWLCWWTQTGPSSGVWQAVLPPQDCLSSAPSLSVLGGREPLACVVSTTLSLTRVFSCIKCSTAFSGKDGSWSSHWTTRQYKGGKCYSQVRRVATLSSPSLPTTLSGIETMLGVTLLGNMPGWQPSGSCAPCPPGERVRFRSSTSAYTVVRRSH